MAVAATNSRSWGEGRSFPYVSAGTMIDTSSEARLLVERIGGGKVRVRGWGGRSLMPTQARGGVT